MVKPKATSRKELTGRAFDALSTEEKEHIFQEMEEGTPEQRRAESTAPSAADRARLNRVKKRIGRPKIGRGTKIVSVTVELDLLRRADAYAKRLGITRAALFSQALNGMLPRTQSAGK